MTTIELEQAIRDVMSEPDARLHNMTDLGGYGIVHWSRAIGPEAREHIVHRWYDRRSTMVEPRLGVHFYSGFYSLGSGDAQADFRQRVGMG